MNLLLKKMLIFAQFQLKAWFVEPRFPGQKIFT